MKDFLGKMSRGDWYGKEFQAQICFASVLELTRSASPQRQLPYSKGLLCSYGSHPNKK